MNWAEHFKRVSGENPNDAIFGILLGGGHTAHELDDWVKALLIQVTDLSNAYDAVASSLPNDPAWTAWIQRWIAFLTDWTPAYSKALARIQNGKSSFFGWDQTNAEAEWQGILQVFAPNQTRLATLYRDFKQLPNNSQKNFVEHAMPQPTAPDFELDLYRASDSALKGIRNLPSQVPTYMYALAAGTAILLIAGATR